MQYPYLTFLEIITFILALSVGLVIFYFLAKRRQGNNFLIIFKVFTLYILGSIFIYLIYPSRLLIRFFDSSLVRLLDFLIYSIILFFIFYFTTRKIFLVNWKKSLICFLLMAMVIFPLLSSLRTGVVIQATRIIPIVAEERMKLDAEIMAYFEEYGISGFLLHPLVPLPPLPLALKIIGGLERAILSWPRDYFYEIAVTI